MTMSPGRLAANIIGFGALTFMVAPLLLVVLFSFSSNVLMTFPIQGVSLEWYEHLFARDDFTSALYNSAVITFSVGALATLIGTAAAVAITRMRPEHEIASFFLFGMPMMMPPLVLALALLSLFSSIGLHLSLFTVIAAHLTFTMPFVILIVTARLKDFDYAVIDSARDLGASPLRTFFTVTLPLIRPTLLGAALIAMALSLDDFVITFFMIGGGNTLPTLVWGMLRTGLNPSINALGTLILAFTIGTSAIALRLSRYRG